MDRTPTRDRWLNSSWTLSPGGTLNRPRGASLEGLSGWIRTIRRAARAQYRARASRGCALKPPRRATRMGATRTQCRPGRPTITGPGPGGISGPPGRTGLRQPHSGPGHGRSLPEPESLTIPEPRKSGPGFYACGPWLASTTPRPTGSYFRPTIHSLNPLDQPPTCSTAARFRRFNLIPNNYDDPQRIYFHTRATIYYRASREVLRATKNLGTLLHKPSTSPKFSKREKTELLRRCCTRSFTSVRPLGVTSKYLPAPSTEFLFPRRHPPVDFAMNN